MQDHPAPPENPVTLLNHSPAPILLLKPFFFQGKCNMVWYHIKEITKCTIVLFSRLLLSHTWIRAWNYAQMSRCGFNFLLYFSKIISFNIFITSIMRLQIMHGAVIMLVHWILSRWDQVILCFRWLFMGKFNLGRMIIPWKRSEK